MADDDAPPGVPEWVVTYGDMMSLLLTFFIMLVSLSEVQANKKFRAVLDSLQKSLGYTAAPLAPPGGAFPLNSVIERMSILGAHTNERTSKGGIKTPQATRGDDVRIFSNRPGNPISAGAPLLFARGSSELVPTVQKELVDFAARLAGKPNKIEVFGHDIPDSADGGISAWNLAYERARRVGARHRHHWRHHWRTWRERQHVRAGRPRTGQRHQRDHLRRVRSGEHRRRRIRRVRRR